MGINKTVNRLVSFKTMKECLLYLIQLGLIMDKDKKESLIKNSSYQHDDILVIFDEIGFLN